MSGGPDQSAPPAKRRSFLQRITGGGGSSSGGAPAPASASAGKASPLNPFGDGNDEGEGDDRSGDDHSGDDDDDDAEGGDTVDDDGLSAEAVARAAQDFTSMRLSVTAAPASSSSGGGGGGGGAGVASHQELRVSASIISADTTKEEKGGSEFVSYKIAVSTGSAAGLSWKVGRRFREFEKLHETLCARFGKDHLPALPKKALRRSLEAEYVRKKKTELAKYLCDLMLDPAVAASEPMAHFLVSSLQEVVRGSVDNLRVFAARGVQIKQLETQMQRCALDRSRMDRATLDAARDADEIKQRAMAAEAAAAESQAALLALQAEWEARYAELAAHAKTLQKEKKSALKFVQDLDLQTRRLKAEKKILVKEIKEQRARMAALGALGTAAGGDGAATLAAAMASGMESNVVSGYSTPATGGGGMASSPLGSPSPSAASLAALREDDDASAGGSGSSTRAFNFQLSSSPRSASPPAELIEPLSANALLREITSPSSTGDSVEGAVDAMLSEAAAAAVAAQSSEQEELAHGGAALAMAPQ